MPAGSMGRHDTYIAEAIRTVTTVSYGSQHAQTANPQRRQAGLG
jgi:hypothetical protein